MGQKIAEREQAKGKAKKAKNDLKDATNIADLKKICKHLHEAVEDLSDRIEALEKKSGQ